MTACCKLLLVEPPSPAYAGVVIGSPLRYFPSFLRMFQVGFQIGGFTLSDSTLCGELDQRGVELGQPVGNLRYFDQIAILAVVLAQDRLEAVESLSMSPWMCRHKGPPLLR